MVEARFVVAVSRDQTAVGIFTPSNIDGETLCGILTEASGRRTDCTARVIDWEFGTACVIYFAVPQPADVLREVQRAAGEALIGVLGG